ncbi:hypothetical protein JMM81_20805 [Bacillus sp. V3B]|uniref:hypothetical protein n=1 Tax=Bacillus sp. V3B TaxID=2804915 RepID=UPI00210B1453|nr:hypothetical protein [Bacillus sp. V3B]MCQ6277317.1 hypothetical protein [Bacillus sp. V3B]
MSDSILSDTFSTTGEPTSLYTATITFCNSSCNRNHCRIVTSEGQTDTNVLQAIRTTIGNQ